ncbi:universal stress protein [Haladaptatus caseinilyticus]|uniref:universal stress protein n=1 Tax=Haladaptatus caseinilyticus TaxID=2993314 RepID=UPI00224AF688|nr:universal stress protein [Haladaptatus caseinilyticus]
MDVLVPIDGSECSFRALDFAVQFAGQFDAALHVVHFSDEATDATDEILTRAREVLEEGGVKTDPELATDKQLEFRPSERVGENVLKMVEKNGYDHVIMGHHESGTIDRAILGSAAETIVRAEKVPVTIVP